MADGKNIKWRDEEVIRLLKCYKQLECLWNTDLLEYKDNPLREAAYSKLLKEMNMEDLCMDSMKYKIKSLRTTYWKLLQNPEMPHDQLFWFPLADSFLNEVGRNGRLSHPEQEFYRRCQKTPKKPEATNPVTSAPAATSSSTVINYLMNSMSNEASNSLVAKQTAAGSTKHMTTAGPRNDEFDHFAHFIAIQLRKLPELEALDLMHDMQVMTINKKRHLLKEEAQSVDQPQAKRKRVASVTGDDS